MAMRLDLPAHLEQDLKEEAEKEGVPPTEHAALLLSICTALLSEVETTPFRDAVKRFLSQRSLDAEHLAMVLEELVEQCLAGREEGAAAAWQRSSTASDANWIYSSLRAWRNSLVHEPIDTSFEVGVFSTPTGGLAQQAGRPRRTARGKYAHIPGTSEDFAREKEEEIAREERRGK